LFEGGNELLVGYSIYNCGNRWCFKNAEIGPQHKDEEACPNPYNPTGNKEQENRSIEEVKQVLKLYSLNIHDDRYYSGRGQKVCLIIVLVIFL
jgi:hypothetical protein